MTAPQDPFSTPPPERQAGSGDQPGGPPPAYGSPAYGTPDYGTAPSDAPQYGQQYGAPQYGQQYGQQPYGQQPFGAPGYGGPPKNGLGIAALVLGILAVMTSLFVFGAALGLVAIVLGVLGRRRAKRGEATNGGMSIGGIVLGLLSLVVAAVVVVAFANLFGDQVTTFAECDTQAQTQAERDQCRIDFENDLSG